MSTQNDIQQIYIGLLGRAADQEGLDYWVNQIDSGVLTLEQLRANIVNEQPEYEAVFGDSTRTQVVAQLYRNLFNREPDADGLEYWVNGGGSSVNIDQLVLALVDGASASDSLVLDNRVEVSNYYTEAAGDAYVQADARAAIADVDGTATSVTEAKADIDSDSLTDGDTFTLTTSVDDLSGTTGNDKFNAFVDNTDDTFTAGDEIDGGAGTDTIRLVNSHTALDLGIATISNVEVVNVVNSGALATLDLDSLALSSASVDESGANLTVSNILTSTDFAVGENGAFDLILQYDDAATNTDDEVNVSLGGAATNSSLQVANVETLNLTVTSDSVLGATGSADNTAAAAAALNIQADADLQLDSNGVGIALANDAVITVTGSGDVNLGQLDDNGAGEGVTLAAGDATGDVTATLGTNTVSATTGAGDDAITDAALGDVTVATGAGNDSLDLSGIALTGTDDIDGTDVSYDLGEGDEDSVISDITDYTADADIAANINNVVGAEVLFSSGVVTALDADDFSSINTFAFSGTLTGGTFNVENDDTIVLTANTTDLDVRPVLDSGTDVLNLRLDAEGGSATHGDIDATQTETLNIVSVADDDLANTNTITALDVQNNTKINVSGDADLTFTTATGTELTVDGGDATGDLDVTVVGGNDVITTGSGDDTIDGAAGVDTIDAGAGDDDITGGAGNDNLTGGDGADTFNFTGDQGTNGQDSITDFASGTDELSFDGMTNVTATSGTELAKGAKAAVTDDSVYVATTDGSLASLTTGGVESISDFTDVDDVDDFIAERFDFTAVNDDNGIIILNDSSSGNAYVYEFNDAVADNTAFATDGSELFLVGVLSDTTVSVDDIA